MSKGFVYRTAAKDSGIVDDWMEKVERFMDLSQQADAKAATGDIQQDANEDTFDLFAVPITNADGTTVLNQDDDIVRRSN